MNRPTHSLLTTLVALFFMAEIMPVDAQKAAPSARWKAGDIVDEQQVKAAGLDAFFTIEAIGDSIFATMKGRSMPHGCTVGCDELRYLRVLHRNKDGRPQVGELVCNKAIAADLVYIFRRLYEAGYPIERMLLIDRYNADDEQSMTANNTSCFCYRTVEGSQRISAHGQGLAIDINPLYNPCVRQRQGRQVVQPAAGKRFANRSLSSTENPYMITSASLVCRLFKQRGFTWGGDWRSLKDYQHFEKRR